MFPSDRSPESEASRSRRSAACRAGLVAVVALCVQSPPLPSPATAAGPERPTRTTGLDGLEFVGQIGGAILAVDTDGRYAYVGVGPRLVTVDVRDPRSPRRAGETAQLGDLVRDVVVAGDRAYVAAGTAGLAVVDVSDPERPELGALVDTPGEAMGVAASDAADAPARRTTGVPGDYVYLADGTDGVRVYDAGGTTPVEVGTTGPLARPCLRLTEADGVLYVTSSVANRAYVYHDRGYLDAFDVRDPRNPERLTAPEGVRAGFAVVVARGDRLYGVDTRVDGAALRFLVLDTSNPRSMSIVGSYDLPEDGEVPADLAVSGDRAFLASRGGWYSPGLLTIDVRDPTHPVRAGTWLDLPGSSDARVAAAGSTVVAGTEDGILSVSPLPDDGGLVDLAPLRLGFPALESVTVGRSVFVAAGDSGLAAVRLDPPTGPVLLDEPIEDDPNVHFQHMYVAADARSSRYFGHQCVYAVENTDDVANTAVTVYEVDGQTGSAAPIGHTEYQGNWQGAIAPWRRTALVLPNYIDGPEFATPGISLYDFSRSPSPNFLGSLVGTTPVDRGMDIAVAGDHAYVASSDGGLLVYALSDTPPLQEVARTGAPRDAVSVAVRQGSAFLAGGRTLSVYDVVDPAHPRLVRTADTPHPLTSVDTDGAWIYAAFDDGNWLSSLTTPTGFCRIDVALATAQDPANCVALPDMALHLQVNGGLVAISAGQGGLYLYRSVFRPTHWTYLPAAVLH
jgi:hypothetical protein